MKKRTRREGEKRESTNRRSKEHLFSSFGVVFVLQDSREHLDCGFDSPEGKNVRNLEKEVVSDVKREGKNDRTEAYSGFVPVEERTTTRQFASFSLFTLN